MKLLSVIARIILGGSFAVFGLNGLLPQPFVNPPPMNETATEFLGALISTGYLFQLLKLTEVVGGLMVLSGVLLPLGLVILAPVMLNIILFHLFLEQTLPGTALPALMLVSHLFLLWAYRNNLRSLFESHPYLTP